ncbi:MFS transporter [Nesterenkonia halobia]|uniref:MFS transporter n=1 Tax=Nesterenkonia halobia TaxID=37922 RepID=A0ABP6RJL7_9MICC
MTSSSPARGTPAGGPGSPTGASGTSGAADAHPLRTMLTLLAPLFASLMSISIVNVALPAIEQSLQTTSSALQWVLSGYALAFGVVLVPAGRAGDLWGRRLFFLLGTGVFGASSVLAAAAPDALVLNAARLLMGLGAGLLVPQIIGMIQRLFTGAARGRAYGLMGTVIGLGVAAGPTIGGLIIDAASTEVGWRVTFLINAPLTGVALVLALLWLPRGAAAPSSSATPEAAAQTTAEPDAPAARTARAAGPGRRSGLRALDPIGVLLLAAAVVLVMLPFIQFRSPAGMLLGLAGLVLLGLWIGWEHRLGRRDPEAPMVDLALFAVPGYTVNTTVLALYFAGMPATWAVVAVHVQESLGHSALTAGLVTLPGAVMVMLLSSAVGRRVDRAGPRLMVVGTALAAISMLALAGAAWLLGRGDGGLWMIALPLAVNGVGQAMIIPSAQTLSMRQVPVRIAGAAGGVAQTAQRLFTALGIAVVTAVYFGVGAAQGADAGAVAAASTIALFSLAALAAAVVAARRHQAADGLSAAA